MTTYGFHYLWYCGTILFHKTRSSGTRYEICELPLLGLDGVEE